MNHPPFFLPPFLGNQNYNDFVAFGGWTHPTMKQFSDSGSACGVTYVRTMRSLVSDRHAPWNHTHTHKHTPSFALPYGQDMDVTNPKPSTSSSST